jgi:alpha-beta hydrolase superfamily lysophospholipase
VTAIHESTDSTFPASDGYRWHFRRYAPDAPPRGYVVFLHGVQSHAGWYEHSCRVLAANEFAVSFLERRGSGRNQQARGDAPSFRRLLDDVAEYLDLVRMPGSTAPRILAGVSWGGKLAVALQGRHPGLTDGLVLLCPGFFPRVRPSLRERLTILWARLTRPSRLFPIPLGDPELFTATPRWLQFLRDDPLALHQATARFLVESVRLDYYLRWAPRYVSMPTLLLLGGRDRIIHNEPTREFVERFAGEKLIIEYPEAHHTLEFEPDPGVFLADLLSWLNHRASAAR